MSDSSKTLRVKFSASCETPGPGKLARYWSADTPEHRERRLKTANFYHRLDLDRRRTQLDPERITVAGSFDLQHPAYGLCRPLCAADGIGTVCDWLQWTLKTVYSVDASRTDLIPLPGLSVTLREAAR